MNVIFKYVFKDKIHSGFTLIELLVVITILAVLSLIGTIIYNKLLTKADLTARLNMLIEVKKALNIYYYEHDNKYPNTDNDWVGVCDGNVVAEDVIPGLYPKYFSTPISDAKTDISAAKNCYYYVSNSDGMDYKFGLFAISNFTQSDFEAYPNYIDPATDGGVNPCIVDGIDYKAWIITSTSNSRGWPNQNCP